MQNSQKIAAARPVSETPRKLKRYLALEDFEAAARKKLPKRIYGYYANGAETGHSVRENRAAFAAAALLPRVLADVSGRSAAAGLFGNSYAAPVGIAPMGLSALACFEGDLALAKAARAEAALYVASATSLIPLERLAAEGGAKWFQCYLPGEDDRIVAMLERVGRAGFETIVLTADVPVAANRENDLRNGFSMPLQPGPGLLWDGVSHLRWSVGTFLRTLAQGVPRFENMDAFRGPPIISRNLVRQIGQRDALSWAHVALMRRHWPGKLVVKGLLHPADAKRAAQAGVDAIWVSNHGGRQLDSAIAPLRMLPEIRAAAGGVAVLVDSGVRRGTDVLKALALGADFVFVGRPFLYAAAAAGEAGVRHALRLMREEIERDMALMGVTKLAQLGAECVRWTGG